MNRTKKAASTPRTRRVVTYAVAANWTTIAQMALASGAVAHYITPWLLAVVVPFVAQQGFGAFLAGRQAIVAEQVARMGWQDFPPKAEAQDAE